MVQQIVQYRAGRADVSQELAPFLQWPLAVHDGGPVFIPAHDHLKEVLAGTLGQLLKPEVINLC
jgi:hypothetical protein